MCERVGGCLRVNVCVCACRVYMCVRTSMHVCRGVSVYTRVPVPAGERARVCTRVCTWVCTEQLRWVGEMGMEVLLGYKRLEMFDAS